MTEKEVLTKEVLPCGMLWTAGRSYFLLHPRPIVPDSWQRDNERRFVAVPRVALHDGSYPHARHVVSNSFTIEYSEEMPFIHIRQANHHDVIDPSLTITKEESSG